MPVNVRRFCTSILLAFAAFGAALAQTNPPQTTPPAQPQATTAQPQTIPVKAPSAAEIMRERIAKAKAYIAVRNYNAAIYDLENIRRETSDPSVLAGTTVLLMNSYLEQGDYKRAQDFLTQAFNAQKANKPGAADIYNAVAGQVIKGARMKAERYKALGLMVSDRNLPLESVNDLERTRETLELVIAQAKEMGREGAKTNMAMAMIEEASASRSAIARDDFDARRWTDEVADSREQIANSRSVITNAVDGTTSPNAVPTQQNTALNLSANQPPVTQTAALSSSTVPSSQPVQQPTPAAAVQQNAAANQAANVPAARERVTAAPTPQQVQPVSNKPSDSTVAANEKPQVSEPKQPQEAPKPIVVQSPQQPQDNTAQAANRSAAANETREPAGPIAVGSLVDYATKRTPPIYPPVAKSMRTTGVVRVEVTVDEEGEVADVQGATGPTLLQAAARDAIRKWRFRPFLRDGQPVKAVGFVNFNFSL